MRGVSGRDGEGSSVWDVRSQVLSCRGVEREAIMNF